MKLGCVYCNIASLNISPRGNRASSLRGHSLVSCGPARGPRAPCGDDNADGGGCGRDAASACALTGGSCPAYCPRGRPCRTCDSRRAANCSVDGSPRGWWCAAWRSQGRSSGCRRSSCRWWCCCGRWRILQRAGEKGLLMSTLMIERRINQRQVSDTKHDS